MNIIYKDKKRGIIKAKFNSKLIKHKLNLKEKLINITYLDSVIYRIKIDKIREDVVNTMQYKSVYDQCKKTEFKIIYNVLNTSIFELNIC